MRLLLLLCLLPVYSIADNLDFSASVDTHFHVVSPANWQESKLAALKVIDAPIDGDTGPAQPQHKPHPAKHHPGHAVSPHGLYHHDARDRLYP